MKVVIVDRPAKILNGKLKEVYGNVVSFDREIDCVEIQVDEFAIIKTNSENIQQETFSINKTCKCGCIYTIDETHDDRKNLCHHCSEWF